MTVKANQPPKVLQQVRKNTKLLYSWNESSLMYYCNTHTTFFIFSGIPVPERPTVSSITASSANLSWLVSPEMEQTPHSFLVSYQSEGTEPKSISTGSCSTIITGLKPGTEYTVNVYTELQHGGKSQPASVQMKTGKIFNLFHMDNM